MKCVKLIIFLAFALLLCGCAAESEERVEYPIGQLESSKSEEQAPAQMHIVLDGDKSEISGEGAELKNGNLEISKGGAYVIEGSLNGSVIVDVTKEEQVELVLQGVNIYSENSAALYVKCADKVIITLAEASENIFYDGKLYGLESGAEPAACIYSADDLTICGEGALVVNANCKNGIQTKNDLRIKGGSITVSSPKNALKGKDSVQISSGVITVTAATDAIKSDNEKEEGRGNVVISGGELYLTCQDDGIQAFRSVEISECLVEINAGDNDINCDGEINIADGCIKSE